MSEYDETDYDPKLIVVYTVPLKARRPVYKSIISNITPQPDNELALSLDADKTYIIEGVIFAESAATQPDIKIGFKIPSGATIDIGLIGASSNSFENAGMIESDYNSQTVTVDLPADNPVIIKVTGTVKVGSTAGNLELYWSQANSNATATTVKEGSYLKAEALF